MARLSWPFRWDEAKAVAPPVPPIGAPFASGAGIMDRDQAAGPVPALQLRLFPEATRYDARDRRSTDNLYPPAAGTARRRVAAERHRTAHPHQPIHPPVDRCRPVPPS